MLNWFTLAMISAVFSALAALGEKKTLFREQALEFCLILYLMALFCSLPLLFFSRFTQYTSYGIALLFVKTALNALAFLCVMNGLKRLELSTALPLLVLTPGFVALAALFFLSETLTNEQTIGLLLLLSGAFLIELRKDQRLFEPFMLISRSEGHLYIITALALFTLTSIMDKIIVARLNVHPYAFVVFSQLFGIIVFLCLFIIKRKKFKSLVPCFRVSGKLILTIAACTVVYRYCEIEAVKIAPIALVLSVKRFSVLFATVAGGRLFAEHGLARKTVATLLLLSGAFLVTL